ncbi:MAG: exopolysaccharide biosynthesis polyprenyl glycosylphosphotransferase [Actinobacteria bacterium]|nr:exopolysaccharide biosynthesis polyprenyl glycosylphosphotransferase [Actinomycetota bacterium]
MNNSNSQSLIEKVNLRKVNIFVLLIIPDCIAISLAAVTAYIFRFPDAAKGIGTLPALAKFEYRGVLTAVVFAWILVLVSTGTYRINHTTLVTFNLRMIIKRSFTFFFFLGFISFIVKASFSRSLFLVMLGSGLGYLFLFRFAVFTFLLKPLIFKKKISSKIMIIGRTKGELEEHTNWLMKNRSLGYSAISRLECSEITFAWIEEFDRILRYKEIEEVLLLPGMETDKNFSKFIHYCEDLKINVNWIPLDSGNLGYWLIPTSQEGLPFLTFKRSEISLINRCIKRGFDLLFGSIVMVLLAPAFILISILILVTSGYPIFYSSRRVGLNGKPFNFYKFRTMIKGADAKVFEVENMHGTDHVLFKNPDDPRITPLGRFLRKYSLDELPQFWNVILNDMSVVGPRPALPREVSVYSSIYERRLIAKPGITGPWQISGRSNLDLQTSVALDLNYLINWSFSRDLWIIFATIGAVIKGQGAY